MTFVTHIKWNFEARHGGYAIRNKHSGKYLAVRDGWVGDDSKVIAVHKDYPEIWQVGDDKDGTVRLAALPHFVYDHIIDYPGRI